MSVSKVSLLSRVTPISLIWSEIGTLAPATLTVDKFGRGRVRWAVPKMTASDMSGLRTMSLSSLRKIGKDAAVLTEVGRVFHNLGSATENAWSPWVARRVDGMSSDEVSDDLKWQRAVKRCHHFRDIRSQQEHDLDIDL